MKKVLNIISYTLNILFICYFINTYDNTQATSDVTSEVQATAKTEQEGFLSRLKSYFESNDTLENAEVQPTLTQEEQERIERENIKAYITDKEKSRLPLTIQNRSHNRVKSITIDSLVFIDNEMPYSGYFVTTWTFDKRVEQTIAEMIQNGPGDKFVRTKKTLYVEIESIRYNYNNELEWHTLWGSAASALE